MTGAVALGVESERRKAFWGLESVELGDGSHVRGEVREEAEDSWTVGFSSEVASSTVGEMGEPGEEQCVCM